MFGREPALWLGALQALLALGVGFGLNVTPEQMGLIMAAAGTIVALIVRQSSVPMTTLTEAGTSVKQVQAAAEATRKAQE